MEEIGKNFLKVKSPYLQNLQKRLEIDLHFGPQTQSRSLEFLCENLVQFGLPNCEPLCAQNLDPKSWGKKKNNNNNNGSKTKDLPTYGCKINYEPSLAQQDWGDLTTRPTT